MNHNLEALFQPLQTGPLRLKNRIVMAPMTRWRSPENFREWMSRPTTGDAPKTRSD